MDKYVVIGVGANGYVKNTNDGRYNVIPITNGLSPPYLPSLNLPEINHTLTESYYFTQEYYDKYLKK